MLARVGLAENPLPRRCLWAARHRKGASDRDDELSSARFNFDRRSGFALPVDPETVEALFDANRSGYLGRSINLAISKSIACKFAVDQVFECGKLRSEFLDLGLDFHAKRMELNPQIINPLARLGCVDPHAENASQHRSARGDYGDGQIRIHKYPLII